MSALLLETQDLAWFRDDLTGVRPAAGRLALCIGLGELRAGEIFLTRRSAGAGGVADAL